MDNKITINKAVNVVAFYFKSTGSRLKCFPKRMEYDGRRIEFTETGLRHPVQKGHKLVHVFDMSDGSADYQLEFDAENSNWNLLSVVSQVTLVRE